MYSARTIPLSRTIGSLLLIFASSVLLARAGAAQTIDITGDDVRTSTWPTVVSLETSTGTCSGTLIGCNTVLTAAHCVCEAGGTAGPCPDGTFLLDPNDYTIFIPHAGEFFVSDAQIAPGYEFGVSSDLAVLTLDFPVRSLAPEQINTLTSPAIGTLATVVGFGTRSTAFDSQIKREGDVITSSCINSGAPDATHVCWEDTSATTCSGDSGGPLFADVGAGVALAGVHSGGAPVCTPGGTAFNADVFVDSLWITSAVGADLAFDACGDGAQVGDPAVIEENINAVVASSDLHSITVSSDTKLLRVALNAEVGDGGGNDLDLYVRFGGTASPADFDCGPQLVNSMEVCEFSDPSPGTWSINVDVFAGSNVEYQLTILQIPENPAPPALTSGDYVVTDFRSWEVMRVDGTTGDRTILSSTLSGSGSDLVAPEGVRFSPNPGDVVVANLGQLAIVSIDPTNGNRTVISGCTDLNPDGSCGGSVIGAGLDFLGPRFLAYESGPDPDLVVSDRSDPGIAAIVRVDPSTGDRTIVSGCTNSTCGSSTGVGPAFDTPFGIAVADDGGIIVGESFGLIRVDPATGERVSISGCSDVSCTSTIGSGPSLSRSGELEIAPSGDILIVDGIRSVLRVDPTTGDRTVISGCSNAACGSLIGAGPEFSDQLFGLELLDSGDLLVVDSGLQAVFQVDGTTGDRSIASGCADASCSTLVGSGTAFTDPVSVAVPEPLQVLGLLAGSGWLAALHRRRARHAGTDSGGPKRASVGSMGGSAASRPPAVTARPRPGSPHLREAPPWERLVPGLVTA